MKLLTEIESFLARHEMAATTFGLYAARNTRLVTRLRDGGDVTTATADQIRSFIRETDKRAAAIKAKGNRKCPL
jgi:hypothetical protein